MRVAELTEKKARMELLYEEQLGGVDSELQKRRHEYDQMVMIDTQRSKECARQRTKLEQLQSGLVNVQVCDVTVTLRTRTRTRTHTHTPRTRHPQAHAHAVSHSAYTHAAVPSPMCGVGHYGRYGRYGRYSHYGHQWSMEWDVTVTHACMYTLASLAHIGAAALRHTRHHQPQFGRWAS